MQRPTLTGIPGGMSLEDYLLMREVIAAIREGLPDADQMQPGQVFQHVLGALRNSPNNAQMDAGRRRMDIALSPPANGPRGP